MRDRNGISALGRSAGMELGKLRSVRSTRWALVALIAGTVLLSLLVCASVDTSGGSADCPAGAPGCGDEDVVLNSLSGIYLGQIAAVALAVSAVTSEFATGTVYATFLAQPRRKRVLAAKTAIVASGVGVAGVLAAVISFTVAQPILHGNGFVADNGYPTASLLEGPAARAVIGTGLYLAAIAVLGLATGTILRRTGAAIGATLGLLYLPFMLSLTLPRPIGSKIATLAPMTAGLAVQRTIDRADSVPIGPWGGLLVTILWAAVALAIAASVIDRRDA